MTLYELSAEGRWIADELEQSDGELTPELEARLDVLLAAGLDKLDAAAKVSKHLQGEAELLRMEAARLTARARSCEAQRERLQGRMLNALETIYGGKAKTPSFTFYSQQSPARYTASCAPDIDMSSIPGELKRVSVVLDQRACLAHYESGQPLPSGIVVENVGSVRSLRVR